MKIRRALISVSDKTGLEGLVKVLNKFGVEILSTGGTAKAIRALGIPVKDVSEHTGFPEMLDGRVKTLHPKVHGGLLALRENKEHMAAVKKHDIGLIDMVVVNLYPFEKTVSKPGVKLEEAIENIDIGGPSMLRSAAKNHKSVCVLCDTTDYGRVIDEMEKSGGSVPEELLVELGVKVFQKTSMYDAAIHEYLKSQGSGFRVQGSETEFPVKLNLNYRKLQDLRYGENPHQKAAFYKDESCDAPSVSGAVQLHGKELSFNNIIDLNAALEIVKEYNEPAATIIKHTNPCGTATANNLKQAYIDALDCDRLSAFGSVVGFNKPVDMETAKTILEEADFVECIIAPSYEASALAALKAKKNLRLLEVKNFDAGYIGEDKGSIGANKGDVNKGGIRVDKDMKKVVGGLLIQDHDIVVLKESDLKFVTKKRPSKEELASLLFGWVVAKHVKSNSIVLCQGTKTVGVGAGQMSRVDSVMIACKKAGSRAKGSTLASDAFFPKEDGIEQAHQGGITAIIQPGGSIRDAEVIRAADKLGLAMVFTGVRHFKH
ncbi:MAG: bifunctional phosphoribosylaminoimidazolecarboxamide formyltransferase/IMP cyclohydrolase [Candidatus Omnitrophota bacterium]|nr:bifunctional phosphoribosylaminoimidazolecarboxamide formyltransferase/IMP cyclohydrolase [Candidatus Omnitrophota bacterium]